MEWLNACNHLPPDQYGSRRTLNTFDGDMWSACTTASESRTHPSPTWGTGSNRLILSGGDATTRKPSPAVGLSGMSTVFVSPGEGVAAAGSRSSWMDVVMY